MLSTVQQLLNNLLLSLFNQFLHLLVGLQLLKERIPLLLEVCGILRVPLPRVRLTLHVRYKRNTHST
jgi:hypothetical protein